MSEPEFIPDEQDFVCDVNAMDFPEPEPIQPEPKFEPESIQLYGEYQNVRLTDSEYKKLDEQFGTVFTEITLKRFSEYVFTSSKYSTYRNHSDVLEVWCGRTKSRLRNQPKKIIIKI